MRLVISKNLLEKHLEAISRLIVASSPFPALSGILITASESNIQFIVSNGNLSIKEVADFDHLTKVIVAGRILVNGKLFREVIRKQSALIEIYVEANHLLIVSAEAKTKLNLLNPEEYPVISFDTLGQDLILPATEFVSLFRDVAFAAADNDKRIILNGVNLVAKNGVLVATATNSYRLAQERFEIKSNNEFNVTIFNRNLRDLYPSNIKGELRLKIDDSKIITQYEHATIVSKVIDGVYPDVSALIPTTFEAELFINPRALTELLDKATVIAEEGTRVVRLTINGADLVIESRRNQIGETSIKTHAFRLQGKPSYEIAFNASFVKEALARFGDDEVTVGFTGQYRPFVIRSAHQPSLLQLVLPHRTF